MTTLRTCDDGDSVSDWWVREPTAAPTAVVATSQHTNSIHLTSSDGARHRKRGTAGPNPR